MRVSVVVCTYTMDMYEHVRDAADGVLEQTYDDVELVLISDGDEDVYDAMCADYGDRENVRIGCNDENRGLSYSRNHGVELATGDVVAFLDDDAVPEPDWVAELVGGYERHDALAVGGKMTPLWVDGKPEFLPEEFYWLVGVTHRGYAEEECEVRNTFGSNISFRREILEDLGGFDENLGRKGEAQGQGEETEIAARMHEEYGESVWYVPDAEVGHKVFDFRTDRRWLLERAFWQGHSKRVMGDLVEDSGGQEGEFLRRLLVEFGPLRFLGLVMNPSLAKVEQLVMLVLLTVSVGLGFLCANLSRLASS
ncbi:glucosyl-dolichyl phosphate glucuronosyltransferase [Halobacterium wangiae]|uniref:glucosyl-dolichyl phosphate glucuronosyltransferase n=1 Tax=Halobacterium wangiae TaxID=2902623 RepID=UPI001E47D2BA|nr:glucosyl-dolichyl phosphate glucuronosyltransferase [Halobacterium wangiae]